MPQTSSPALHFSPKIRRALISVSDKNDIEGFVRALKKHGVEILSTGGTAAALRKAGIGIKDVSDHTGFPEIMEGRVKTLHPKIHGGILAKRNDAAHRKAQADLDIGDIDLLVVNLYPFTKTVQGGADFAECIENIDIGGPAMIRAAAKNHESVTIIVDPKDYDAVLENMAQNDGAVTPELRKRLAATAFCMTALYDSDIANWFTGQMSADFGYPRRLTFGGTLQQVLRYGENPHQHAALYTVSGDMRTGAGRAAQVQGKDLSYNNLNDTDAAWELVCEFDEPAVAIIKHANPCGVAVGKNTLDAYRAAYRCDPTSAFGGIIALNRPLDRETAAAILEQFVEVIIAPEIMPEALDVLRKKDKIRVLAAGAYNKGVQGTPRMITRIAGGLLVQDADAARVTEKDLVIVTERQPTPRELHDMLFAFTVAKHVKSNAIVYAKDSATVGIGAGQMSRIDSSRIAALKMKEAGLVPVPGQSHLVVASDAFFPFADGLITAAEAGVTAVIQPGGSIRDGEVIRAANERGLAMAFTGIRHFRH
ncbi:MAG: bifunctional phosphoribosylaminoimidazolecarboxamide formyltransferase/IMP cyclohydrolase [Alphaproteobacteria bacterium]